MQSQNDEYNVTQCHDFVSYYKISERIELNFNSTLRGGVAQWVARQTRDRWIPVSREFEPHQRPPLFP